ncbi:MAG: DUF4331 domain-containing protein [Alkalinema sp. CAN_BIN05]|nr:DUF4331 domain-containing protein [Alkalinema sp. CAN_BIN05]
MSVPKNVVASDHDDGETSTKGRNVNLTDLYVFREKDQNAGAKDDDLVFVMNTNPRSVARQQYYFSNNAQYEFHVSRVANKDDIPTGKEDITLRFEFSKPEGNAQQTFRLTAEANGRKIGSERGTTTPLSKDPKSAPKVNDLKIGNSKISVFAGLREDPFFFDVEQFFRVRAGAAGIGPKVGFRPANEAIDFAKGYNVNAIVVRVPRSFLQGKSKANVFDVWETISTRDPRTGRYNQVERLGRPAINEGLIVTNAFLNAFNSIPPRKDLSDAAAPVRAEAKNTLLALGNSSERADTLLAAFLPDVMRIDTTIPSGYLNALNGKGSPIAGRMLLDDTIDQTLSVLTNGAVKSDNVSYNGSGPSQGHQPLVPQFPYLAFPN